jgi:hypothetical protein
MIRALSRDRNPLFGFDCARVHAFYARTGPIFVIRRTRPLCGRMSFGKSDVVNSAEDLAMRRTIEIAAAALLLFCISAAAAGRIGHSADGLSCAYGVPANASPAARCAAIRRQCGGKFAANYCGGKLLSAM